MLTLVERRASRALRENPVVITNRIELTPAQSLAAGRILAGLRASGLVLLRAGHGMGRTTVLRHVHSAAGGTLIGAREFMTVLAAHQANALEEAFLALVDGALDRHDLVIIDDFHLIKAVVNACDYPRTYLLDIAITAMLDRAAARRKQIVLATNEERAPQPIDSRAYQVEMGSFGPGDYESLCRASLDSAAAGRLNYAEIHRFAPDLNAHQIGNSCAWVKPDGGLDTARFIEYLAAQNMTSNVELEQVQPVDWNDLKGFDDVIQALEAKVALPFENHTLAAQLQLKPKRGVLLAGPPGTCKTTIGRALAARLKGKFFLIDGTVIAGTDNFYTRVRRIFDAAKHNAPSVVFIDDGDLIFENSDGQGFH